MPNAHSVLGLSRNCTEAEVKQAFRSLALQTHPDKVGPSGTDKMKEINLAYETIVAGELWQVPSTRTATSSTHTDTSSTHTATSSKHPKQHVHEVWEGSPYNRDEEYLQKIRDSSGAEPWIHDPYTCAECEDEVHEYVRSHSSGDARKFRSEECIDECDWRHKCAICDALINRCDNIFNLQDGRYPPTTNCCNSSAHPECALKKYEEKYGSSKDWFACLCGKIINHKGQNINTCIVCNEEVMMGAVHVISTLAACL